MGPITTHLRTQRLPVGSSMRSPHPRLRKSPGTGVITDARSTAVNHHLDFQNYYVWRWRVVKQTHVHLVKKEKGPPGRQTADDSGVRERTRRRMKELAGTTKALRECASSGRISKRPISVRLRRGAARSEGGGATAQRRGLAAVFAARRARRPANTFNGRCLY